MMTDDGRIHAPWTTQQVERLNWWQTESGWHPFTCGSATRCVQQSEHAGKIYETSTTLVATPDGWRCPKCSYTQNWAWDYMADPESPAVQADETRTMTREKHLDWCKARALAYCDAGDVAQAWASMVSDLRKHPETEKHAAIELGSTLLFAGHLDHPQDMRKFIEGFN